MSLSARSRTASFTLVLGGAAVLLPGNLPGQGQWNPEEVLKQETFARPPALIERIITAPRTDISFTNPAPDGKWFVRVAMKDRGDISDYGKAHIYLGGLAIDTTANRARQLTMRAGTALILVDPVGGVTRTMEVPRDATISSPTWSPDGKYIAYLANFYDRTQLYLADVASGKSILLTKSPVLAVLETGIDWSADGKSVAVVLVPGERGLKPTHGNGGIEDGPQVRLTEGRTAPQRVYWSLLEDPHDKELLKYYTRGQAALVDIKSRSVKKIGTPAMIRSLDLSPDGRYLRVSVMTEPFSYIVPTSNFGSLDQVWDLSGQVLVQLDSTPLREGVVGDGGTNFGRGGAAPDTSRRSFQWNPVGPGLTFLQSVYKNSGSQSASRTARGAGAPARGTQNQTRQPSSVRFMQWLPPFGPSDTALLYEGSGRLTNVMYSADGRTMFVADSGTVLAVRTADPSRHYSLGRGVRMGGGGFGGFGRGGMGGDNDDSGGALDTRSGPSGSVVVVGSDGKTVFLSGTRMPGANWQTEGPRPWVDRLDFESGQRTRVFDAAANASETFVAALDDDYSKYLYKHESPSVIPDVWLRDVEAGTTRKVTNNVEVAPEVVHLQRMRMQVTRQRDSLKFWVDVTMPADWKPGTRLPGIIWFYPREYTTQAEVDRSRERTNIFAYPGLAPARPASSIDLWATQGYALLEPDTPIIGDSGRMNDNYIQDLRENLDAVIDAAVAAGYVDRERLGLGGHSYGAFSTANAMTVVPYFKAGIAGDGMYNRSLTPFGFQSERRTFYTAQDTYLDVSPFLRADKLTGALLMYHSIEDQNVGTALLSSVRMMQALQGLGKTAALYMYPYEDHSVGTWQTDLDQWARWLAWFDIYVKNPKADSKAVQP